MGPLTLVSSEVHLPYQRPPLSKAWLKGEAASDSFVLRAADHYPGNDIEVLLGTTVRRVGREDDGIVLSLDHTDGSTGTRRFDRLVLATGARARRLDIPGADHRDVLVLRELDHAHRLAERVAAGPVVVIGGAASSDSRSLPHSVVWASRSRWSRQVHN